MRRLALLPLLVAPVVLLTAACGEDRRDDAAPTGGASPSAPVEVGHPEGPGTETVPGEVGHPEGPGTERVPTGEVGHPEGPGTE